MTPIKTLKKLIEVALPLEAINNASACPRPPVRVLGFPGNKKEQGEVRGGRDWVPQPEQKAGAHCLRCSGREHPGFARDRQP
jgi:hypothetical protein